MTDHEIELDENNKLTIRWNFNSAIGSCSFNTYSFNLTRKDCNEAEDNCEFYVERVDAEAGGRTYTFSENLQACTEYNLKISDNDNLEEGEKTILWYYDFSSRVQGKINLTITQDDPNIERTNLKWEYLDSGTCPNQFDIKIYLGSSLTREFSVSDVYQRDVDGLEPCETYIFLVYPNNSTDNGANVTHTLNWLLPGNVEDLNSMYKNVDNTPTIDVTWNRPIYASKCVIDYAIKITTRPKENLHTNRNTTNLNSEISNVHSCTEYNISVNPRTQNDMESAEVYTSTTTPARPYKNSVLSVVSIRATSVTVNTTFDDNLNQCEITGVILDYWKTNSEDFSNKTHEDTKTTSITIDELEPFTEYEMQLTILNDGGPSETNDRRKFKTSEGGEQYYSNI